jgi:hypothetical protein
VGYRRQYGCMRKKKSKQHARALMVDIKMEMQEPRLTKSVRDDRKYQAALLAKEPAHRLES